MRVFVQTSNFQTPSPGRLSKDHGKLDCVLTADEKALEAETEHGKFRAKGRLRSSYCGAAKIPAAPTPAGCQDSKALQCTSAVHASSSSSVAR